MLIGALQVSVCLTSILFRRQNNASIGRHDYEIRFGYHGDGLRTTATLVVVDVATVRIVCVLAESIFILRDTLIGSCATDTDVQ